MMEYDSQDNLFATLTPPLSLPRQSPQNQFDQCGQDLNDLQDEDFLMQDDDDEDLHQDVELVPESFCCQGVVNMNDSNFHPESYLCRKVLTVSHFPVNILKHSNPITLFQRNLCTSSAFIYQMEHLFQLAYESLNYLEMGAEVSGVGFVYNESNTTNAFQSDFHLRRKEICLFITYINKCMQSIKSDESLLDWFESDMQSLLINWLKELWIQVGTMKDLPDAILVQPASNQGNKCTSPLFHLFHLHLDIRWFILSTLRTIKQLQPSLRNKEQNVTSTVDNLFDKATRWCCMDLLYLASKQYNKASLPSNTMKTSPFGCTCIKELWVMLLILLKKVHNGEFEHVWHLVHDSLKKLNAGSVPNHVDCLNCSDEPIIRDVSCNNTKEFVWWLTLHLAWLSAYNEEGVWLGRHSSVTSNNYKHLRVTLNQDLQDNPSEAQLRFYMHCLLSLKKIWGPDIRLVLSIWEYFSSRLNHSLVLHNGTLENIAVVENSGKALLDKIKGRLNCETDEEYNISSFNLFLQLIGAHMAELCKDGACKEWRQFKGKICFKFYPRRMQELNERGLYAFSSLFLTMACITDTQDVTSKFMELLKHLPSSSNVKVQELSWKSQIAFLLLLVDKNENLHPLSSHLIDAFNATCKDYCVTLATGDGYRRRELHGLIDLYMVGIKDISNASNNMELDQYKFITPSFTDVLSLVHKGSLVFSNSLPLLTTVIGQVANVIKNRVNYGIKKGDSCVNAAENCCQYILPSVKNIANKSSVANATIVADIAAQLTLLALNLQSAGVEVSDDFSKLFKYFGFCDKDIVVKYLISVLSNEDLDSALKIQIDNYQTLIIQMWFRCLLFCPEISNEFQQLTAIVSRLPDIDEITRRTHISIASHEDPLNVFIKQQGIYYEKIDYLPQKLEFSERFSSYVSCIESDIHVYVEKWEPALVVKRILTCVGELLQHCHSIIYTKGKPNCLLIFLLNKVILPPVLYKSTKDTLPHNYAQGMKEILPMIINGLSKLHYERDPYISRCLKDVISNYVTKYSIQRGHPFFRFLGKCSINDPEPLKSLRTFIFDTLHNGHLKNKLVKKDSDTVQTVRFMLEALGISDAVVGQNLIHIILPVLLESFVSTDDNAVKPELIKLLKIIFTCMEKVQASGTVSSCVCRMIEKHMAFNSNRLFHFFINFLGTSIPNIVIEVYPVLEQTVKQVEEKRGTGHDRMLRFVNFLPSSCFSHGWHKTTEM